MGKSHPASTSSGRLSKQLTYQPYEAITYEASLSFTPNKDSCSPQSAKSWNFSRSRSHNQTAQSKTVDLLGSISCAHTALSSSLFPSYEAPDALSALYLDRYDASPSIPNPSNHLPQIVEMRADSHLQTYRSRLQISTLHYSSSVRTAAPSFLHSWWRKKKQSGCTLPCRNTPSYPSSPAPTLLRRICANRWA